MWTHHTVSSRHEECLSVKELGSQSHSQWVNTAESHDWSRLEQDMWRRISFLKKMVACAVGMTFERNMRFVEMSWDFWGRILLPLCIWPHIVPEERQVCFLMVYFAQQRKHYFCTGSKNQSFCSFSKSCVRTAFPQQLLICLLGLCGCLLQVAGNMNHWNLLTGSLSTAWG